MGAGDGVYVGTQEQEVDQDVDDLAGRPSGWMWRARLREYVEQTKNGKLTHL